MNLADARHALLLFLDGERNSTDMNLAPRVMSRLDDCWACGLRPNLYCGPDHRLTGYGEGLRIFRAEVI